MVKLTEAFIPCLGLVSRHVLPPLQQRRHSEVAYFPYCPVYVSVQANEPIQIDKVDSKES